MNEVKFKTNNSGHSVVDFKLNQRQYFKQSYSINIDKPSAPKDVLIIYLIFENFDMYNSKDFFFYIE